MDTASMVAKAKLQDLDRKTRMDKISAVCTTGREHPDSSGAVTWIKVSMIFEY
jgi:hypothetical protein